MSQEDITSAVPHLNQRGYNEKGYLDDDKFADDKFGYDGDVQVSAAPDKEEYVSNVVPVEEEVIAKQCVIILAILLLGD